MSPTALLDRPTTAQASGVSPAVGRKDGAVPTAAKKGWAGRSTLGLVKPGGPLPPRPAPLSQPASQLKSRGATSPLKRHSVSRLRMVPFVVLVCTLLGLGLVTLLLLNTALSQGAFVVEKMSAEQARHAEKENALGEQLSSLNSPDNVAQAAQRQGLVPDAQAPCFVWVEQNKVCALAGASNSEIAPLAHQQRQEEHSVHKAGESPAAGGEKSPQIFNAQDNKQASSQ